jgi:hypothetical protein
VVDGAMIEMARRAAERKDFVRFKLAAILHDGLHLQHLIRYTRKARAKDEKLGFKGEVAT